MNIIRPTRRTIRQYLKTLVDAEMVGDGKPLVACYAYEKGKLKGVVPCLVFVSEDVEPFLEDVTPGPYSLIHIGAHAFCLYEDIGTGSVDAPEYTEEESEDDMDDINQQLLSLLTPLTDRTGETDPEWDYMFVGKTQADTYKDLEGLEFRHEYYPMVFQVPNIA